MANVVVKITEFAFNVIECIQDMHTRYACSAML